MQSCYLGNRLAARKREMQVIDMEMDDIKLVHMLKNLFHQHDVMRQLVRAMLIETQGTPTRGHQPGFGDRVAARKKRNVVTLLD
jgi:hypothetical protein